MRIMHSVSTAPHLPSGGLSHEFQKLIPQSFPENVRQSAAKSQLENPSWRIQAVLWQRYSVLLLMKLCSDFEAKSTDVQTTMRSEQTVTIPVSLTGMMIQTLKSRSRAQEFEFSSLPGLPTRCGRFETSFATCTAAGIVLGNEGLELLWRGRRACG